MTYSKRNKQEKIFLYRLRHLCFFRLKHCPHNRSVCTHYNNSQSDQAKIVRQVNTEVSEMKCKFNKFELRRRFLELSQYTVLRTECAYEIKYFLRNEKFIRTYFVYK